MRREPLVFPPRAIITRACSSSPSRRFLDLAGTGNLARDLIAPSIPLV